MNSYVFKIKFALTPKSDKNQIHNVTRACFAIFHTFYENIHFLVIENNVSE